MDRLLGVKEIGQLLGVSRQRADQLTKQEGFPVPAAEISAGRIWRYEDIVPWAYETGRLPHKTHDQLYRATEALLGDLRPSARSSRSFMDEKVADHFIGRLLDDETRRGLVEDLVRGARERDQSR